MTSSISVLDMLTNLWFLFLLLLAGRGSVFSSVTCTCSEISLSTTELFVLLRIAFSISIQAKSSFSFSSSGSHEIPKEKSGNRSAILQMGRWRDTIYPARSLISDKARCFSQSERALHGNFELRFSLGQMNFAEIRY